MPSAAAPVALAVLGLVCTAAGLVVYGMLVAEAGAGRALVITYVNPVVAVALGVAFLGERPGPGALVGLALILVGSWLATTSSGAPVDDTIDQTERPDLVDTAHRPVASPATHESTRWRAWTRDSPHRVTSLSNAWSSGSSYRASPLPRRVAIWTT
jgi:EamA-like transporter family